MLTFFAQVVDIVMGTCYNTNEVKRETYQEWLRDRAL